MTRIVYRGKGPDFSKDKKDNDQTKADTLRSGFKFSGRLEKFSRANAVEQLKLFSGLLKLTDCSDYFQKQVKDKNIQLPMWASPTGQQQSDPNANAYRPDALSPLIISSGTGAGAYLSTDPDPACGGYASGRYIYRLDFGNLLTEYNWMDALPVTPRTPKPNAFWPKLWLITGKIPETSEIIAVAHQSALKEVTFLTPIPANHDGHQIISLLPVDPTLGNIISQ